MRFNAIQSIFGGILIYQARWRAKSFPINHVIDLHFKIPRESVNRSNFDGGIKLITCFAAAPWLFYRAGQARSIPRQASSSHKARIILAFPARTYSVQTEWENEPTESSVGESGRLDRT